MTRNQTNHHANDRTNHQSFLKFRGAVKILRLGSKFRGPQETVGPNHNVLIFDHRPRNSVSSSKGSAQ